MGPVGGAEQVGLGVGKPGFYLLEVGIIPPARKHPGSSISLDNRQGWVESRMLRAYLRGQAWASSQEGVGWEGGGRKEKEGDTEGRRRGKGGVERSSISVLHQSKTPLTGLPAPLGSPNTPLHTSISQSELSKRQSDPDTPSCKPPSSFLLPAE